MDRKVAVISGGAGGIGRATASRLAEDFYPIILDRDESAGEEVIEILRSQGREGNFLAAELTKKNEIQRAFNHIISEYGCVDALVNLAGGTFHKKLFQDLCLAEWEEVIAANLKSTFLCCQAVIDVMKKRRSGVIVNTSSNFGFTGSVRHTAYAAAKYAIVGFTKSLAVELAPYGVRANCLAPGLTATARVMSHHSQEEFEAMGKALLMGRAGDPKEVAEGVAFLVSEDSRYMTGQTLHVNGGMVLP